MQLVKQQHEKAKKILLENRSSLDRLAQFLYEKETITGEEFMSMLNETSKSDESGQTAEADETAEN